ncbi:MAG: hypothetical protein IPP78_13220 [Holophagaceae bacterium]|nr:hypothetical protein [Holophagaceae bacterium]
MTRMDDLQLRLQSLEKEILEELNGLREGQGYHLEGRRVRIQETIRKAHRARRKRVHVWLWEGRLMAYLVSPVIYAGVFPALLLDLFVVIYQFICFPAYGIPRVKRKDYMVMDRRPLPYLNWIEIIGCVYCSYFNGLMAMVSEVAARTEQHFCPIKHALRPKTLHSRYGRFFDYGDMEAYRTRLEAVRHDFADLRVGSAPVGPRP